MIIAIVIILVLLVLAVTSLRVLKEYERGVAFRLGRLREPLGPGVRVLLPGLDKLVRVDLRVVTLTIPPQEVITRDNVPARVNAVVLFRVVDPVQLRDVGGEPRGRHLPDRPDHAAVSRRPRGPRHAARPPGRPQRGPREVDRRR